MLIRLMPLGTEVALAPGDRLLDALDELELPVLPTACRSANCGLCTVVVRGDGRGLAPPAPAEQRFLAGFGVVASRRLGCQIHAAQSSTDELVVLDVLTSLGHRAPP